METFGFALEQRLQCVACASVRYRVDVHNVLGMPVLPREKGRDAKGRTLYKDVALAECVEVVMGVEGVEYKCPNCLRDVAATKCAEKQSKVCQQCGGRIALLTFWPSTMISSKEEPSGR
jgi:uncharacterized UBP type Zn finger protein